MSGFSGSGTLLGERTLLCLALTALGVFFLLGGHFSWSAVITNSTGGICLVFLLKNFSLADNFLGKSHIVPHWVVITKAFLVFLKGYLDCT